MHKNESWVYSANKRAWEKEDLLKLSDREKMILVFSAQRYTESEIAEKLHCSTSTVKSDKQKVFELLEVHRISDALLYALTKKII